MKSPRCVSATVVIAMLLLAAGAASLKAKETQDYESEIMAEVVIPCARYIIGHRNAGERGESRSDALSRELRRQVYEEFLTGLEALVEGKPLAHRLTLYDAALAGCIDQVCGRPRTVSEHQRM